MKWLVLKCMYLPEEGFSVMSVGYLTSASVQLEYKIHVFDDGDWFAFKRDWAKYGGWREVNGVCEDAEPVFKAALPKAQALAILKG